MHLAIVFTVFMLLSFAHASPTDIPSNNGLGESNRIAKGVLDKRPATERRRAVPGPDAQVPPRSDGSLRKSTYLDNHGDQLSDSTTTTSASFAGKGNAEGGEDEDPAHKASDGRLRRFFQPTRAALDKRSGGSIIVDAVGKAGCALSLGFVGGTGAVSMKVGEYAKKARADAIELERTGGLWKEGSPPVFRKLPEEDRTREIANLAKKRKAAFRLLPAVGLGMTVGIAAAAFFCTGATQPKE